MRGCSRREIGMIEFRKILKRRNFLDLKIIDLNLESGYIHLINGKNSHGKSTLLKLIAGVIQPDEGEILINGLSVDDFKSQNVVSYMPDVFPLDSKGTIEDLMNHMNGFKKFATVDFRYYMSKFSISLNRNLKELSLGESKIVHLCLALSKIADIYLLDEPSLHMDREHLDIMQMILQEVITDESKYIIIATNNVADFINYADYLVYLKNGSVVLTADRESLMSEVRLIDKNTYESYGEDLYVLWKDERSRKYLVLSDDTLGDAVNGFVEILRIVGDYNG